MTAEYSLDVLGPGIVRAESGPMILIIEARRKGLPDDALALDGGRVGLQVLADIASEYRQLRMPSVQLQYRPQTRVGVRMLQATRVLKEPDIRPMAAVAGSIADEVADWLTAQGADKVVVDNGGDIAIRLGPGASATIGLQSPVHQEGDGPQVLQLTDEQTAWGVATSGLGGRSLTKGIASAVSVLANSAAEADAAATAIANTCFVHDPRILQVPARSLNPDSDLGDDLVTVGLEPLEDEIWAKALKLGMAKAENYLGQGFLQWARCVVGTCSASTAPVSSLGFDI